MTKPDDAGKLYKPMAKLSAQILEEKIKAEISPKAVSMKSSKLLSITRLIQLVDCSPTCKLPVNGIHMFSGHEKEGKRKRKEEK